MLFVLVTVTQVRLILESQLIDARAKKTSIETEKIKGNNIHKILIYFDKLSL